MRATGNIFTRPRAVWLAITMMVGPSLLSAQTGSGPKPFAQLDPVTGEFWVGELFPLTFKVWVPDEIHGSVVGPLQWRSEDLDMEDWSEPARGRMRRNGVWMITQTVTNRGYAPRPGSITVAAASQKLNVKAPPKAGSFQQGGVTVQVAVASAPGELTIKPLPEPIPAGFSGAVGQFELNSSLSIDKVNVGESVTWRLALTGTGNWPQIRRLPERKVAKSFEVVSPGQRRTSVDGSAFDAALTEELMLVPRRPGDYTLPAVSFIYFDPVAGAYRTLTTPAHPLLILGTATGDGESGMPDEVGVAVPESPPVLPLDPSGVDVRGVSPLPVDNWWILAAIPAVGVLLFWVGLAARRRHLTDPLRRQRLARERILALLRELNATPAPTPERMRALLGRWEESAAELLGLSVNVPTGAAVELALAKSAGPDEVRWRGLWRDADRYIYAAGGVLPHDWVERAERVCGAAKVRRAPWLASFLPRNLLPFAVAASLVLLVVPMRGRDAGMEAYVKGDFDTAETEWAQIVAAQPLSASTRYNRALALAQLDRWSESAAESLAALCLAPRNEAIRWQLALSLDRAGIDQPTALAVAHRPGSWTVVTWFSVGEWAWVFGVACSAAALALGGALVLAYHGRTGRRAWWPVLIAGLAMGMAVVAVHSRGTYAMLAETDTAIVRLNTSLRSVPTAANAAQKMVPLPAGSLATGVRSFLGWTQLAFPNGQTGWVRTDELTWIYR
ncbi:BatD family protein [Synoicihabitans lomoniglobus]|uniref:BatD family protein n=2 Tax=Synoicihabitans lomoniglobus TaxID=2909285 RepID=A0AAF0CQ63_9BACT|nr:BatD family protein [Opitutaceae bacterium LMO-M01]